MADYNESAGFGGLGRGGGPMKQSMFSNNKILSAIMPGRSSAHLRMSKLDRLRKLEEETEPVVVDFSFDQHIL